jgi:hypothetical protein
MSVVVDDPVVVPCDLSDDEVLARCREVEAQRRAGLAEHLVLMREVERRKLYVADGHRDLAGFGRAEFRWSDRDAKAHRDLERLCRSCPQVIEQLMAGRVGAAQMFLLGRLARAPRVGMYVIEQIDDFLRQAGVLSFVAFEQYVIAWKCLMDQDGPNPDRAHRNRKATLTQTGLTGFLNVEGPAVDHARLKVILARFEEIEFRRDWEAAKAVWGDQVCADRLARTAMQRRYDAFQSMLDHVTLPTLTDPDLQDSSDDSARSEADTGAQHQGPAAEPAGPVQTVLNIVIDAESAVHGLEQLLGISIGAPVRAPFGADRAFCQTFDGDPIGLRDAVLAGIAGKIRIVLRGADGLPTTMSSASRLFTGAVRDAVLLTATHCTHPGCIVPASRCQIDHLHPRYRGGVTSVCNGGGACGHHNRWRYAAQVTVVRLADGTFATYRPNGTRIAPPTT